MKKVLCDKDGKFLSIHDEDCTLTKLEDGDCLTHEDGTISYHDSIPSFRFSTEEEKERMYKVLSEYNLYYDEKEKRFKRLR